MSWHSSFHSSKFRHVIGRPATREHCYDGVPITRSVHDNHNCSANPCFIAVVTECVGGGSFLVLPIHDVCKTNESFLDDELYLLIKKNIFVPLSDRPSGPSAPTGLWSSWAGSGYQVESIWWSLYRLMLRGLHSKDFSILDFHHFVVRALKRPLSGCRWRYGTSQSVGSKKTSPRPGRLWLDIRGGWGLLNGIQQLRICYWAPHMTTRWDTALTTDIQTASVPVWGWILEKCWWRALLVPLVMPGTPLGRVPGWCSTQAPGAGGPEACLSPLSIWDAAAIC